VAKSARLAIVRRFVPPLSVLRILLRSFPLGKSAYPVKDKIGLKSQAMTENIVNSGWAKWL
jgi:hypothetical protein